MRMRMQIWGSPPFDCRYCLRQKINIENLYCNFFLAKHYYIKEQILRPFCDIIYSQNSGKFFQDGFQFHFDRFLQFGISLVFYIIYIYISNVRFNFINCIVVITGITSRLLQFDFLWQTK